MISISLRKSARIFFRFPVIRDVVFPAERLVREAAKIALATPPESDSVRFPGLPRIFRIVMCSTNGGQFEFLYDREMFFLFLIL